MLVGLSPCCAPAGRDAGSGVPGHGGAGQAGGGTGFLGAAAGGRPAHPHVFTCSPQKRAAVTNEHLKKCLSTEDGQ